MTQHQRVSISPWARGFPRGPCRRPRRPRLRRRQPLAHPACRRPPARLVPPPGSPRNPAIPRQARGTHRVFQTSPQAPCPPRLWPARHDRFGRSEVRVLLYGLWWCRCRIFVVSPKPRRRPQSLPVFPGRRHVIVVVSSRAASGASVACSAFADPASTAPAVLPAGAPSLPLPLPLPSPARLLPQASSLAEPRRFPQAFSPTGPRRFPPSLRRCCRPPVLLRPIAFRRAHRRPAQPPAVPHSPPPPTWRLASRPLALQA